jgi:hypothetical protein
MIPLYDVYTVDAFKGYSVCVCGGGGVLANVSNSETNTRIFMKCGIDQCFPTGGTRTPGGTR